MSSSQTFIVYIHPSVTSSSLPQSFGEFNLPVVVVKSLDDVVVETTVHTSALLVLHTGATEESTLEVAREVIKRPSLHGLPLVLFGHAVDEVAPVVSQYFGTMFFAPSPFTRDDIRRTVRAVLEYRPVSTPDEARLSVTMELAEELDSVPQKLLPELRRAAATPNPIGGEQYSSQIDFAQLKSLGLAPSTPKVAKAAEEINESAGEWGKGHLCRTAFVACRIFEACGLDTSKEELVKGAAFLSVWSLGEKDSRLRRDSLLDENKEELRRDLCSKIKDSAFKVAVDLQVPELGMVLSTLGKLIGQEEAVTDDEACIIASILMSADIIDRVCFSSGRWEGRNAYHLMRRLKSGDIEGIHQSVLVSLIRFLSEAITTHASMSLLPKDLRNDPDLRKQLSEYRNYPLDADEERVTISALTPGMVLSKPLIAFDGRKILSEGIVLDQDLIYRLWQLTAVRPLNPAVITRPPEQSDAEESESDRI